VYEATKPLNEGANTVFIEETQDFRSGLYYPTIEINGEILDKQLVVSP
jgi:hypothetical protein